MVSTHKLKSVNFYRMVDAIHHFKIQRLEIHRLSGGPAGYKGKIPRDLTEASLPVELNNYFTVSTSTSVIVDKSSDGEFLRIDFNFSFPALSCEFAAVDVSDILGTYPIDPDLKPTGFEFHTELISRMIKHDDEVDEEYAEGSFVLTAIEHFFSGTQFWLSIFMLLGAIGVIAWCQKPSWEKAAGIIRERYNPDVDGRILLGKVDCTEEVNLCRRHHIQGYPSIRIFRKGSDVRMIEHYLQVVKTELITRRSNREQKSVEDYEYTAHSSLAHSFDIPVAKFHFELSPMQVQNNPLIY
ncbi:unnamed protein product [Camellia sinensis]